MSDRPTPETDEASFSTVIQGELVKASLARRLERQRDAYAYTLRVILKSAGQHVSDAIRHTHPELAGNEKSPDAGTTENSALDLASRFHETYERLAPQYGYETRLDTRAFDPASKNGKLMVAACAEIIEQDTTDLSLTVGSGESSKP